LKAVFKLDFKPRVFLFLAFLVPLAVRLIPEILMGSYVVGFDTLAYYVPNTLVWLQNGVGFWSFLATAPFLYVVLMGVTAVGVPIVATLKVVSPLLLGVLGASVYFFANKTLSWSPKKSFLAVLFATLYFVALRVSWDMLRSELALIFLFVMLIFIEKEGKPLRNGVLLSLAMLSVVFAHQLVAVVMLFIVLVTVVRLSLNRRMVDMRNLVVCSIPAVFLFSVIVYANFVASPQFSVLSGFPAKESEGFMALAGFASYSDMVFDTLGFLVFCFLPLLPLVVLGFKRFNGNLQLKAWILWAFVALLVGFVIPSFFVVALPHRWILLLTYPLAFFAADAFARLKLKAVKTGVLKVGVGVVLATLSLTFLVLPYSMAFPYFSYGSVYTPVSMLHNTMPLSDCQDTVNALQWVGSHMDNGSRLLVHDAFYGWAVLTLGGDRVLRYGYDNPASYAEVLVDNGSTYPFYLIWWVNGSGWHGQPTVSSVFEEVYTSGEIAVYSYHSGASDSAYLLNDNT
jgi:hypothetical protein